MARTARVNIIKIVVESMTQSLIVDSMRATDERDDAVIDAAWAIWQANGMDRRQFGLSRAITAYGTGYEVVLPGRPVPVVRPVSPRSMTALYGDDDLWPAFALERRGKGRYRLYDEMSVYPILVSPNSDRLEMAGPPADHGAGVTPVVRFRDAEDLDLDDEPEDLRPFPIADAGGRTAIVAGQVAPLIALQDQVNLTSFSLKAAEWYAAFRQRWMVGKTLTDAERMKAGASQLWAFDEDPDSIRLGEFGQTDLRGYIESRAESMKFAATLSQTPVHELVGELVNLSAEALAAAEIGRDRMVDERKTSAAESHEQALRLAVGYGGMTLPNDVEMVYRDTSARAFGAVVDGLGKIAQMLQVPPQELWEKIPGVTRQDVKRWQETWKAGDPVQEMNDILSRQAGGRETRTSSGLILPPGTEV
jgi:hypothetical protein